VADYACSACGTVIDVDDPASVELWALTEGAGERVVYVLYSAPLASEDRRELHRCERREKQRPDFAGPTPQLPD
jgi:hypothetical protein